MNELAAILAAPFAACLVLTVMLTYLGMHVLAREVIFVDLALAQIAALGASVAFLLGYKLESGVAYLFALGASFLGASIFSLTRMRRKRIPQEAFIGIVYAVSAAAAIVVTDRAPHGAEHLKSLLVGSILWVTWPAVAKLALLYTGIGLFQWVFRNRFLTISIDEERARREGWKIRWWDFLFYASFAVVVTSSVQIAGVLLVFSFLIVPAVCGSLFSNRLPTRLVIGWSVGLGVSATGCLISYVTDSPTGATVVCTFGAVLLLAGLLNLGLQKRTGPLRSG